MPLEKPGLVKDGIKTYEIPQVVSPNEAMQIAECFGRKIE
jgi:hypothetical protein